MEIRKAIASDVAAVVEIMNQAIRDTKNAYLMEFDDVSGTRWFNSLLKNGLIVLVATIDDAICGWGTLTHYREGRGALADNTEITFYVHNAFKRRGVGMSLIKELENHAHTFKKTQAVAILLDDNAESKALLHKMGYVVKGEFPGVAHFPNKVCGHLYMWKSLVFNQDID